MRKIKITSLDELGMFLGRAYWLESEMEQIVQWEAYVRIVESEHHDILFQLSHDSASHRLAIEKLCSNLKGFDLDKVSKNIRPETFDFKNKQIDEMFGEILRYEFLAQDLYTKLKSFVCKDFIAEIWKGDDPVDYYKTLNMLVKAEGEHIELLQPFAGRVSRIH